jgi:predicted nucleic acid-binding protein
MFVDTSFWIGLLVARDRRHPEAAALWRTIAGPLLTTNLVVGDVDVPHAPG